MLRSKNAKTLSGVFEYVAKILNDSATRTRLGIPDGITFDVSLLLELRDGVKLKVTAAGNGLTPKELYDAEWKAEAEVKKQLNGVPTNRIYDHA